MEQKGVYKINYISVNNIKSQFCFSSNKGIKTFNTEDFSEQHSIDELGNISYCVLIRELNIVIFTGFEGNELYTNKKIIVYDLNAKKELSSTSFLDEVRGLKIINKFLLVTIKSTIKIFSLENFRNLQSVKDVVLPENEIYDVWESPQKEDNLDMIFHIVYSFDKEISVNTFVGNDWKFEKKKDIKNKYGKIQGLFYIQKLDIVFAVDEKAKYIYGLDPNEGKEVMCVYRGSVPGEVTSMSLINQHYLLLNNINRTIYIINLKPSGISLGGLIGKYGYGIDSSIFLTIKYDEIMTKEDGTFFQKDFSQKGSILWCNNEDNEFYLISYNGYAFRIKINFLKGKYNIASKKKFAEYKIMMENEEENVIQKSSKTFEFKSIFDKSEKKKNDDKFVNL